MARYNTVISATTTTAAASLTAPLTGVFTSFTGTAPYTVTIGDPVLYSGGTQTFYNATSGVVTLSFTTGGIGKFVGPGVPGNATTQAMPAGSTISISSDGTNWAITYFIGGALSGSTLTASSTVTLSPTGASVTISPTGGLTISPTSVTGTIDNVNVGASTRGTGAFTTLAANSTFSLSNTTSTHTISSTNVSSGTGSGALVISGGLGVAGRINASDFTGTVGSNTRNAGAFTTLAANGLTTFTQGGQGTTATDAAHSVVVTGGLGVSGTIYSAGLVETSSIAFKENVLPMTTPFDLVLNLQGVTYDRKDTKQHESGLIAEEVYKILPDLVSLDASGKPHGVKYTKLSVYLLECIKSLKQEINELKGKK
jgi:hypothetical protein